MKRKGGGKLALVDFLPEFAKEKRTAKDKEKDLKGFFMAMAQKEN